jgi:hypothetical protein
MRRLAIVTHEGDLHALMVQDVLRRAGEYCAIVASDRLAGTKGLSCALGNGASSAVISDIEGERGRDRRSGSCLVATYAAWRGPR